MISPKRSHPVPFPTQLLLGTLLGFISLGASAQQASANPLQAIPIVSDILGITNRPVPLPDQLEVFTDSVNNNNVSVCVLTCIPGGIPGGIPGLPTGARPPQQRPNGARPPAPGQIPSGARPPAPRPNSPNVSIDLSPINIPLK